MNIGAPDRATDRARITRIAATIAIALADAVERAVTDDGRPRTARGNAWEAVRADRDRARRRTEARQAVAALANHGTSPDRQRVN